MFYENRKSRKEIKSNLPGDELLDFVGEERSSVVTYALPFWHLDINNLLKICI